MRTLAVLLGMLTAVSANPPHILFVLVDDLGWGDVGFHRNPPSKDVITPNIDALVQEGIDLDRHYVHMFCTPTRTSVQSGRLPVHVTTKLVNPEHPNCGIPRNMTGIAQVMKKGGYATHLVGKWDAGMATPKHTPQGRGYDTSLGYFEHKNDFYTMKAMQTSCNGTYDLWDTDKPSPSLAGSKYEEELFEERLTSIIHGHNPAQPLFLFYTPHVAHCPLQVPPEYMERFSALTEGTDEPACSAQTPYVNPQGSKFACRAQYHAMVNYLDNVLGNITTLLKTKGMWEDTLMVFSSDNGGPLVLPESGSNNWPLRGSKYSPWEGGIRAAAFASGGYLPQAVRGTKQEGVVHIADWYATFAHLAGVDPTDKPAAESHLPPIDSINVWDLVRGANATSPRTEVPIDDTTLIEGDLKLILGGKISFASWGGPHFPNSTSHLSQPESYNADCTQGCLYNVVEDPHELTDIASENQEKVQAMKNRLNILKQSYWENNETGVDACPKNATLPNGLCACWFAANKYGGFLGPYQEVTP
eukprot:TRINITY_DN2111_c2_g1_i1.p1 TRINITY_DN2111_c2_g1~~TRINITY_DN2111_c2_g1_i1.p1  ORF type:complete len:544 (+),score=167.27 TRINITY_DN2111_c2_g1_i1:47-1633(+)